MVCAGVSNPNSGIRLPNGGNANRAGPTVNQGGEDQMDRVLTIVAYVIVALGMGWFVFNLLCPLAGR